MPLKNTIKTKVKTLNPSYEHSIDRLNELDENQMIGAEQNSGLAAFSVKELRQRIKPHNEVSQIKMKGYGKTKKCEL